jgi:hypothetical protein
MRTHVSLAGLLAAVMLFGAGVAMHEAARADRLIGTDVSPIAGGLVVEHGK